jgi:hypothetical protein
MSDEIRPPIPFPVSPDERPAAAGGDEADETRARGLPEHEVDEDTSIGGGVLGQGGTAIDRGTGTTDGQAQGETPDDEDGDPDLVIPNPQMPV